VVGWAARDASGHLTPYTYTVRYGRPPLRTADLLAYQFVAIELFSSRFVHDLVCVIPNQLRNCFIVYSGGYGLGEPFERMVLRGD
jgi:hypothetical protein